MSPFSVLSMCCHYRYTLTLFVAESLGRVCSRWNKCDGIVSLNPELFHGGIGILGVPGLSLLYEVSIHTLVNLF